MLRENDTAVVPAHHPTQRDALVSSETIAPSPSRKRSADSLSGYEKMISVLTVAAQIFGLAARVVRRGPNLNRKKSRDNDSVMADEEYGRWMHRRDEHLARIRTISSASSAVHANVAMFEEWLEGNVSNERLSAYMAPFADCQQCQEAYEYYKVLKSSTSDSL